VSPYNFEKEVTSRPEMPSQIKIYDSTLRDGEQTPGVVFRKEEKIAIAKMLDEIGVDRIETGMPAISEEDQEATKAIAALGLNAEVYCICNAQEKAIDLAVPCGVDGIEIGFPTGLPRLKYEFPKWTEDTAIDTAMKGISYAREKGIKKIILFLMDSSRSEKRFLERFLTKICQSAPPDAFTVVDTAGCFLPQAAAYLVRFVKKLTGLPVEIHTHNDMGLGLANTLAGIEAGAQVAHVCVNGLGERGGNVPLDELAIALRCLYGYETKIKYHRLTELAKMVEKLSRIPLNRNKPVIGDGIFTRESGMGLSLVKKTPLAIYSIDPRAVGQDSTIVLGKKSGKESVEFKANELAIQGLSEDQKRAIVSKVKERGIEKKGIIDDNEFREIVSSVLKDS
jgi:isopropylmalate/homocitrate/citramalate synthase